jgi:hypothetical protein
MGIGAHTYPSIPALTEPETPFAVNTNVSPVSVKGSTYWNRFWQAGQPKSFTWMEAQGAHIIADGYSPMRIMAGSEFFRVGILPPVDVITAAPTGAKASAQLQLTGLPNDGDSIVVGNATGATAIYFKTALVTSPSPPASYPGMQVLIGATVQATLQNLQDLINDGPGHDSTYHNAYRAGGFAAYTFAENFRITSGAAVSDITFTALDFGTVGNSYPCATVLDSAGVQNWLVGGGASPAYMTGGSDGTGTAPEDGDYYYTYRHYRKGDGALSGIGEYVKASLGIAMNVALTMTDPSDDPQITHLQWMRSLVGSGQFYRGDEIKVGTGGTDTDDKLDTEIAVGLPYNPVKFRPFESGHVPSYRVVESHLGRVWGGGAFLLRPLSIHFDLTEGSRDAAVVTASQPFHPNMEGGIVVFDSFDSEEYLTVDYDGTTIRLNKPWPHATGQYQGDWRDGRDPTYLAWSEPGLPNQWPPANGLEGVVDETGEGITGLKAHWSRLNVFTPESIYALSGVDSNFQLRRVVEGIGTTSHHGIVEAEGALYFPGSGHFYVWGGDEKPIAISDMPGESPRGLHDTMDRINWAAADMIQGHFDPIQRLIRWVVPVDDSWVPNLTLVFSLDDLAWHLDTGMTMSQHVTVTLGGGTHTMGVHDRLFFHADIADSDNFYVATANHVLTIQTVDQQLNQITTEAVASGTDRTFGAVVITADGTYYDLMLRGQGGTYDILGDWDVIRSLAPGSQILMGGILFWMRTGEMSFGYMGRAGRITDLDVGFIPQTASGRLYVAVDAEGSDTTLPEFGEPYGDLTESDGHFRARLNSQGRRHTIDLIAAMPGGRPEVMEMGIGYRTPNKNRTQG